MAHDLIPGLPEPEAVAPLFDESNPNSLINIVWTDFRPVLRSVGENYPEYFQLSEARVTSQAKPEVQHRMMRARFWAEYDIAQQSGRKMMQKDVTRGICTPEYWSRSVSIDPKMIAYIVTPPPRYISRMESMLDISLDGILEIIELPIKDKTGKIDTRLIAEKVKIFQLLDLRVKGAVMQKLAIHQRIDQHTQITEGTSLNRMNLTDLEALDDSIRRVKTQIERTQNREILQLEAKKEMVSIEDRDGEFEISNEGHGNQEPRGPESFSRED